MKNFLKKLIKFWISKTKQLIEKFIEFWVIGLLIFELIICPFILIITDKPILLLIIWIGSFVLWYPFYKTGEKALKKEDKHKIL